MVFEEMNEKNMGEMLKMLETLKGKDMAGLSKMFEEMGLGEDINLGAKIGKEMGDEISGKITEFNDILRGLRQSGLAEDVDTFVKELIVTFAPVINAALEETTNELTKTLGRTAKYEYAKYKAYVDAGFSEDQAFSLINKSSSTNELVNAVSKQVSEMTRKMNASMNK